MYHAYFFCKFHFGIIRHFSETDETNIVDKHFNTVKRCFKYYIVYKLLIY